MSIANLTKKICACFLAVCMLSSTMNMDLISYATEDDGMVIVTEGEELTEGSSNADENSVTQDDTILADDTVLVENSIPTDETILQVNENSDETTVEGENNSSGDGGSNGTITDEEFDDEDESGESDATEIRITSADELEIALSKGYDRIQLLCDFTLDRTFFVTKDTVIYATEAVNLVRDTSFGGDIFVVGPEEKPDDESEQITVTFGDETAEDCLITIDGNKSNMTVDVVGTVFFVRNLAQVEIRGINVKNAKKVGNETALDDAYGLSYPERVGGAVVILSSGKLDIYSSEFTDNEVSIYEKDNADAISGRGGAIYSFAELNVYDSTFKGNTATRGGALYNYRKTHLVNTVFEENTVSTVGGAVYVPASTSAFLYTENTQFNKNSATEDGGAIYSYGTCDFKNTSFTQNSTETSNGGAVYVNGQITDEKSLVMSDVIFDNNTSAKAGGALYIDEGAVVSADSTTFTGNKTLAGHGGAVYVLGKEGTANTTLEVYNSTFTQNQSSNNAGAVYFGKSAVAYMENVELNENESLATSYGGGAIYSTASTIEINGATINDNYANANAGAIALYSDSILTLNNVTALRNSAASNGGFIYSSKSTTNIDNSNISAGSAKTCGATYFNSNSTANIKNTTFSENISEKTGGAIMVKDESTAIMEKITATANIATTSGGFVYNEGSVVEVYDSEIRKNTANTGGAIYFTTVAATDTESAVLASGGLYNTKFIENEATSNSGALHIYTGGGEVIISGCEFESNKSGANGGVAYISNKSIVKMYNNTARNNSAVKGGFLYETTTGTTVTIKDITVSKNSATDGGSFIWGNSTGAVLYIDKLTYTDLDATGELDDDYWAEAIFNKLTVYDVAVPDYGEDEGDVSVSVARAGNAAELESAINQGFDEVLITKSFEIDRTFYITKDMNIYSESAVTLLRAPAFGGDMFVLGPVEKSEDKTAEPVTITFGSDEAKITIDGNKDNVSVDNLGTVFFVRNLAKVEIRGLKVTNAKKVGNEIALDEAYALSYASQVGGAVAILASGELNVYNSEFTNNEVSVYEKDNDESISGRGAVIYSFGELNVYNSSFTNNHATKAGAIYNYRETHLTDTTFEGNTASTLGGAIYIPSSTVASVYTNNVSFKGNSAASGGAIYAAGPIDFTDTSFVENEATSSNGGAIYLTGKKTSKKSLEAENVTFTNNTAAKAGGAIYIVTADGTDSDGNAIEIGAETLLTNAIFTGNKANAGHGGAVWASGGDETDIKTLELYDVTFDENQTSSRGGAIYFGSNAVSYMENVIFTKNKALADEGTAYGGGAVYGTGATIEINGAKFIENTSDYMGGAIEIHSSSVVTLNDITAERNVATQKDGGFMYAKDVELKIYNSYINGNSAALQGGAISIREGTTAEIYKTKFVENKATADNGGALFIYTNGGNVTLNGILFKDNVSAKYGGAIYISGKSVAYMYNIEATGNSAANGGFMYETTTGTTVNLNGLTVKGNTATTGGPIIWGNTTNATLNINKTNYVDKDATGELDDTYWSSAIVNKLTVKDLISEIPNPGDYGDETTDGMDEILDVRTIDELETALTGSVKNIRIISNIIVDRTLYVTGEKVLFTTTKRTVKRSPDFTGDMFVVGEDKDGNYPIVEGIETTFTLGNPQSETENLLIIDGNKDNITGNITGCAIFVAGSATLNIYGNTSLINNYKNGNIRTLNAKYNLASPEKVGGAAITNIEGSVYIYDGVIKDNISDGTVDTINGGAIHNRSNFTIYDGLFQNNEGSLGGVIYNGKRLDVLGGQFLDNHSLRNGGAIYVASSQYAHLYVGKSEGAGISDKVLFKNNTSDASGGALYNSVMGAVIINGDVTFDSNYSATSGGAVGTFGTLNINNAVFMNNSAKARGGAVYLSNSNDVYTTRIVNISNSTFEGNQSTAGGVIGVYASNTDLTEGGIVEIENCNFNKNKAVNLTDNPEKDDIFGGVIFNSRKGSVTITNSNFTENSAEYEGGVIYTAGESTTTVTDSTFKNNTVTQEKGRGGVLSIHSASIEFDGATFEGNSALSNGGALYVSYTTASTINSSVKVNNSEFNGNTSGGNGGAIYATEHEVEDDKLALTVKNTEFKNNQAIGYGGAVYTTAKVDSYMKDVDFTANKAGIPDKKTYGGAIYMTSGSGLEVDTATFTENEASYCGGGIALHSSSELIVNNITADSNKASSSAGFLYGNNSRIIIYDSTIKNNTAGVNGGAMAFYNATTVTAYGATIEGNTAGGTGGAIYSYQNLTEVMLHSCAFKNNEAAENGGAVYLSNEGILNMFNTEAVGNKADKGGFLYETTTGTEATLRGIVVEGNSATTDGNNIFGNSYGATLYIDKIDYEDRLSSDTNDETYWDNAIKNMLTVVDISGTDEEIPERLYYVAKNDGEEEEEERTVVPVENVLSLGVSSSDDAINNTYGKLPVLDKSSNFMSDNVTEFEDINGETVTVDTFVYHPDHADGNGNFGLGMLFYQAILYKAAHPEEDVKISIAEFRFEMETAVCINRNSRYFGYMRNLVGADYDKYGFVRISYLLVTAAKMGIDVTVMGQIPGYPHSAVDPEFREYFEDHLKDLCDPVYVGEGKKVADYMKFVPCDWTSYEDKAGSDMMHLKMATASHYLDMNGVAHKNAIFSSTSNLDGINGNATNGNNKMQTATIVTNHEGLYRTATNYINLIAENRGQEDVYIFRSILANRTAQQFELILAGKENEIPADEQIVYLGTENDDVFELYFTPFGGELNSWDEKYNPYCKYIRKLNDSEDYIILTWNNANYISSGLVDKIEGMIIEAYHNNKNPNNKIYVNLTEFDASAFDDLEVGTDIGVKSFNKKEFGALHTKDLQVSYVENGKRSYVTLFNSLNMHSGAISYQANFLLAIKEDSADEGSVFFTLADNTTKGIVEHTYGSEEKYIPEGDEDGYVYRQCIHCGKQIILSTIHKESDWTVIKEATTDKNGVSYKYCKSCGKTLEAKESIGKSVALESSQGVEFSTDSCLEPQSVINGIPHTFEAIVNVPKNIQDRAGVIIGNYKVGVLDLMSFEIYSGGRVRLYSKTGGVPTDCTFDTDIRSDEKVHIAITLEETSATLYVNGKAVETKEISVSLPNAINDLKIGGDNRAGNTQYFKGTIYSVALFDDVRTANEIKEDMIYVSSDSDALLYSEYLGNRKVVEDNITTEIIRPAGETFDNAKYYKIGNLKNTPHTFEAVINVPVEQTDRAGVVVSNYVGGNEPQIAIEIYSMGKPRLFYVNGENRVDCTFNTDIRSDKARHIAIVVDGQEAILYVDGQKTETRAISVSLPDAKDNYAIGGDYRTGNSQYFKGTIYSVALFDDARTEQEIKKDVALVKSDGESLLYSGYFTNETEIPEFVPISGITFSQTAKKDMYELKSVPYTFEAVINVPKSIEDRAGVIVGNYASGVTDLISLEIYSGGRVRLYSKTDGVPADCIFDTDVRSDELEHIIVTVDGTSATLYLNGQAVETKILTAPLPNVMKDLKIGGDNRYKNVQYFKGTIYSVALYSDAKTADEIKYGLVNNTDEMLYCSYFDSVKEGNLTDGKEFTSDIKSAIPMEISAAPHTFEAVVQVPEHIEDRAGVIVGNYDYYKKDLINLEVYTLGRVRIVSKIGGVTENCIFDTDIRSDKKEHIAVTVDGTLATLYINGKAVETKTLSATLAEVTDNFKIGGDNRAGNSQYFKGKIYSVALFSDVRTPAEIVSDMISVDSNAENLLYNTNYALSVCEKSITGGTHVVSDWIIESEPTESKNGRKYKMCTQCSAIIEVNEYRNTYTEGIHIDYESISGLTLSDETDAYKIDTELTNVPLTYEAIFRLPKTQSERAGVLVGNYDGSNAEQVNIEIYTNGKPRLYYKTNNTAYTHLFNTDVRSDSIVHLAITIDGLIATLYINGVAEETVTLDTEIANACSNYRIGADCRTSNSPYFKGTICSVAMFSDVRTAEEIKHDMILIPSDSDELLFSKYFMD